jgi:hypothetical protein
MKNYEKYLKKMYKSYVQNKKDKIIRTNEVTVHDGFYVSDYYVKTDGKIWKISEKTFLSMKPFLIYEASYPYTLNSKKYETFFLIKDT